jgi:hypothetical protein
MLTRAAVPSSPALPSQLGMTFTPLTCLFAERLISMIFAGDGDAIFHRTRQTVTGFIYLRLSL